MGHRLLYRTVFYFFRKARAQPLETLNITDFALKSVNRTVTKTKAFVIFNFNRESYRTEIWSVYRFLMVKTILVKIRDFTNAR